MRFVSYEAVMIGGQGSVVDHFYINDVADYGKQGFEDVFGGVFVQISNVSNEEE